MQRCIAAALTSLGSGDAADPVFHVGVVEGAREAVRLQTAMGNPELVLDAPRLHVGSHLLAGWGWWCCGLRGQDCRCGSGRLRSPHGAFSALGRRTAASAPPSRTPNFNRDE